MARGGRKDQPINREQGPVAEFVDDLRRLRGALTLNEIGHRMQYHPSTLSRRLTPKELPPQDFVDSYVRACGHDPGPWIERRRELSRSSTDPQVIEPGSATETREAATPWWKRPHYLVPAAAVLFVPLAVYLLLPASPSLGDEQSPASASRASGPPVPEPGRGFPIRIDRMAFRIFSPWWTQTSAGDIEFWSLNVCPQGTTTYWVAVHPTREAVRFACNTWQYHKWADVPAGTYHLEIWKEHDGQSIKGSGAMRSSVPIVVHPKSTPTPSST
ncbi:hypothetical protein SAMN05421874_1194 [Nonomuraea maritima]|uniref:Helix-turn-helix domain-containing protein n=2 Tax=Nonomuraea maritima TaxID=683260 RepID=A0A1G9IW13_9ACTN|nr:hypothetical protein SAMN05421874_1194 [Nonomuraea maritima]